jgi:hypothetical protein
VLSDGIFKEFAMLSTQLFLATLAGYWKTFEDSMILLIEYLIVDYVENWLQFVFKFFMCQTQVFKFLDFFKKNCFYFHHIGMDMNFFCSNHVFSDKTS